LANLLAVLVGLWIAGLLNRTRGSGEPRVASVDARAVRFMAVLLFGPPLLTIVVAAATASGLRSAWSNSMFNLAGIFAVGFFYPRFGVATLKRICRLVMVLLVLLPLGYAAVSSPFLYSPIKVPRAQWPQRDIARRFQTIWATATGGLPLRIVTGRSWVAGLVGLTTPGGPSILNSGSLERSPWLSQERIGREGMLIVWDGAEGRLPASLEHYRGHHSEGTERFKVPGRPSEIIIHWIVVMPRSLQ